MPRDDRFRTHIEEEATASTWVAQPFTESSRVAAARYDKAEKELQVLYRKTGAIYAYHDVSSNEWAAFRRSASAGKYVNRVLNSKRYHPTYE